MTLLSTILILQCLAGAGGGGFMVMITKEPNQKETIEEILTKGGFQFSIHDVKVDRKGMQ